MSTSIHANEVSSVADSTAQYAAKNYTAAVIETMTELIKFNTVNVDGVKSIDNEVHRVYGTGFIQ